MRVFVPLLVVVGLASIVYHGVSAERLAPESKDVAAKAKEGVAPDGKLPDGKLIVHEWGTFTSISGSDGTRLEFRPLLNNDLPEFVVNRAWQAGRVPNPFAKWDIRSLQRMETPVTYFYTDREREVDVKVGFPKGLLTEFYPPVASMKPAFDFKKRAAIANSELSWGKVTLIPADRFMPKLASPEISQAAHRRILEKLAPECNSEPHYAYARETDSAFVYVSHKPDKDRPVAPVGDHFEKFLFYRGVGNFSLPLTVVAKGNDTFEVSNTGSQPLKSLFLITNIDNHIRVASANSIDAGAKLTIQHTHLNIDYQALSNMVVEALVAEGLYEKEARAMVNTWRDSWFGEPGTRLFYTLPRTMTDELLPLTISPAPDQVVRVMVGRMEIISPEEEARITEIIQKSAKTRALLAKRPADSATSQEHKLPKALVEMGRLAEPTLVRVKAFTMDSTIRDEAAILLNELQVFQTSSAK
jgi:hypothetical protein